ncbi:hypothetical protein BUALT_Bualt01G0167300 [Buddleja alternifolia]|uniref:Uncharacterized protein n=1 Tax=Buddleja alternifolia TaxID=168488 RepID=A0AAV6YI61_9LAMI|nr:hypothetical protein BUALT_Bualt01G0167300 [Buddleja alternifolia]
MAPKYFILLVLGLIISLRASSWAEIQKPPFLPATKDVHRGGVYRFDPEAFKTKRPPKPLQRKPPRRPPGLRDGFRHHRAARLVHSPVPPHADNGKPLF